MEKNKSKKVVNKEKKQEIKKEKEIVKKDKIIETRTIEQVLRELRMKNNWSYLNLLEELSRKGIMIDEKTIKKWESGLEYPDLDTIYKLSEIFDISSQNLVIAKNNSYNKGFKSIYITFIKRFCYVTGISIKIGYIGLYVIIAIALTFSILFLVGKCDEYLQVRSLINR